MHLESVQKKLFLIDGMALIYRAHFAMIKNPLITKDGRHTSAIYGFLNSILKVINEESPDYFAVVLDSKSPTFRHELFTEYKANRAKMPEELSEQIPPLYDVVNKMNIPLIKLDGYEADDLIGTIAKKAEANSFETYIVTGDKDMMQLVSDNVFVYSPGNRFKPTTIYNINKVKDRWGIGPDQFIDYLAMVGDSSDNIPGVEGIGAKSAVKLLTEHSTLERILEKGPELSNKRIRDGIKKGKDLAYLSKKLVTIDCDVPCDFHLEKLILKDENDDSLASTLQELELSSLVKKISSLKADDKIVNKGVDKNYKCIKSISELELVINQIKDAPKCSFDIIPKNFNYKSKVIQGISLCISKNAAWYIPLDHSEFQNLSINEVLPLLRGILENSINLCSQNIKHHMVLLSQYDLKLNSKLYDIVLAEHLLSPEKHSYPLEFMSIDYCNFNMSFSNDFFKSNKRISSLFDFDIQDQVTYACEQADMIFHIFDIQKEQLISQKLYDYYFKIERPLVDVLASMEACGVYVDREMLSSLSINLSSKIDELTSEIFLISGYEFNINSPQQLAVVMFDELELKQIKKRSTAVEVLKVLKNHHPIAELILDYRHLVKLKNTYLDALPRYIDDETERIHTSFNQTTTITGRLSSSNPNFQNIPIRTNSGRRIRKAFRCQKDGYKIISADYSQVELRIMVEFSKESNLIDAFNNGVDVHTRTAALINNISESEVSSSQRRIAKVVNFGIMYGAGPFRMSQELGISIKEAKQLIEIYFLTYPKIKQYMENTIQFAREHGYVETLLGRRKKVNLNISSIQLRKAEERASINMPIQGTSAELIKLAMINIFHKFKINNIRAKMILQIHDELLFECHLDELNTVKEIIVDEMEQAVTLSVPLKVTCDTGNDWQESH